VSVNKGRAEVPRSKQTHITMTGQFHSDTTQKEAFNHKTPDREKAQAAIEAKQELRKAHFNFGSSSLAGDEPYTTTNMEKQSKIREG
jgi:hypothetical protein